MLDAFWRAHVSDCSVFSTHVHDDWQYCTADACGMPGRTGRRTKNCSVWPWPSRTATWYVLPAASAASRKWALGPITMNRVRPGAGVDTSRESLGKSTAEA